MPLFKPVKVEKQILNTSKTTTIHASASALFPKANFLKKAFNGVANKMIEVETDDPMLLTQITTKIDQLNT
jgi:hypothetical protein